MSKNLGFPLQDSYRTEANLKGVNDIPSISLVSIAISSLDKFPITISSISLSSFHFLLLLNKFLDSSRLLLVNIIKTLLLNSA